MSDFPFVEGLLVFRWIKMKMCVDQGTWGALAECRDGQSRRSAECRGAGEEMAAGRKRAAAAAGMMDVKIVRFGIHGVSSGSYLRH
jgi:hypothetical protein